MGKYPEIDAIFDDLDRKQKEWEKKVLKLMNDEVAKEMELADKEFGEKQQAIITDIFNDAVKSFYDDYKPKVYKERQFGLYELLSLRLNDRGLVENGDNGDYQDFFDETQLHTDRHGGSLYELTFLEGWHGGAKTISSNKAKTWGAHPLKGTPYYRTGGYVILNGKRVWHKYGAWGRQAKQTTPSPFEAFKDELMTAEGGRIFDLFKKISTTHNNKAMARVNEKLPQINMEVYG